MIPIVVSTAEYAKNDGPLGKAPDISVGASDKVLLGVSIVGFAVMAYTVYSIILTKVKSSKEIEDEEKNVSFEDRLAQADVSTLTRAQRRARARHIAKQQRRVPTGIEGLGAMDGEEGARDPQNPQPEEQEVPPMEDGTHHAGTLRHLSRKERQKAAKEIELKERKLLEDQRRKEQLEAQEGARLKKKAKERQQAKQADEGRKRRQEQREADELTAYYKWRTFLPPPCMDGGGPSEPATISITVKEWNGELQKERNVAIASLSKRFGVSDQVVEHRIHELLEEDRVAGFLDNVNGNFVHLSPNDMAELASFVESQDKMDIGVFQQELSKMAAR
ncbi:MAG: hypothetical protein SGILL_010390 [Bacillariaceae sp.]